jgi:hypothetical protein
MSQKSTKKREPNNTEKIKDKWKKMQRKLRDFSEAVHNIRDFVEPDTDFEV